MKKLLILILSGLMISFFSCKKDAGIPTNATGINVKDPGPIKGDVVWKPWTINSFIVDGTDISGLFQDFIFNFQEPYIYTHVNSATYTGTQKNLSDTEIGIYFNLSSNDNDRIANLLTYLNSTWTIQLRTEDQLVLETSENGTQKMVTFEFDNG